MAFDVDCIIIGSGAGGGTAALALARQGKKVLVLERGRPFTDREAFQDEYRMLIRREAFDDRKLWINGREERLFIGGVPGGGTALYGAALLRPARDDFHPRKFYHDRLPSPPPTGRSNMMNLNPGTEMRRSCIM